MSKSVNARLVNGALVPDVDTIRSMMADLRDRVSNDPKLQQRWESKPRAVLADMGLARMVQNSLLEEEGRQVKWTAAELDAASGCYGCSGCCCSGCCVSGVG